MSIGLEQGTKALISEATDLLVGGGSKFADEATNTDEPRLIRNAVQQIIIYIAFIVCFTYLTSRDLNNQQM